MILATCMDTGLPGYIRKSEIVKIETLSEKVRGRPRPFSRIYLEDKKQHHAYFLDVKENPEEIERRFAEERLDPGCEIRGMDIF